MRSYEHGYHQCSQIRPHIAIQLHQFGKRNSSHQSSGDIKEESVRRASSAPGFPSGNYVWCERLVHGGRTGVHQGDERGQVLGKIAHHLGGLLPFHLCRVVICGCGVQHADDGSKYQKGIGAEVNGEEVLHRS